MKHSVYEAVESARRDYELYRNLDRVRRMVKTYYNIIAKFGLLLIRKSPHVEVLAETNFEVV
jgi:hypothetical protein